MPTNRQAHTTTPATTPAAAPAASGGTRAGSGSRPPSAPPKYQQVADALREQIESGVLPPGAPLPTEAELMAAHEVSQPTARSAVRILREQGLITTYHGRGSFVRHPASDRPAHTFTRGISRDSDGTYRDVLVDVSSDVEDPSRYRTNATPTLALALGVAEHTPVFVYDRLMTSPSGQRFSHRTYVPFPVAADVPALEEDPYRTPGDLYTVLAHHHTQPTANTTTAKASKAASRAGSRLSKAVPLAWTEHVRARTPTPDDTHTLRIPEGTPLLLIHRETRDHTGRLLALEETRTPADNAQLTNSLIAVTATAT